MFGAGASQAQQRRSSAARQATLLAMRDAGRRFLGLFWGFFLGVLLAS